MWPPKLAFSVADEFHILSKFSPKFIQRQRRKPQAIKFSFQLYTLLAAENLTNLTIDFTYKTSWILYTPKHFFPWVIVHRFHRKRLKERFSFSFAYVCVCFGITIISWKHKCITSKKKKDRTNQLFWVKNIMTTSLGAKTVTQILQMTDKRKSCLVSTSAITTIETGRPLFERWFKFICDNNSCIWCRFISEKKKDRIKVVKCLNIT